MIVLITGRPGSGKGTQTDLLVKRLGFTSFGFGQALRKLATADPGLKAIMDKGQLVPIEIIDQLWGNFLASRTTAPTVIDGWPRDLEQAEWLIKRSELHPEDKIMIIEIDTPASEIRQRLANRGRDDDDVSSVETRLKVYDQQTRPAQQELAKSFEYIKIDGQGSIDQVFNRIRQVVSPLLSA